MSATSHRIDIRPDTVHVRIELAGQVAADSRRCLVVDETRCPRRYYVPREDVCSEILRPSPTRTHCPYKGDASYWHLRTGEEQIADVAWSYEDPVPASEPIRGYLCFYPERVDRFQVDGVELPGPRRAAPSLG